MINARRVWPCRSDSGRARAAVTLIEVLLALVLTSVIAVSAWSLVQATRGSARQSVAAALILRRGEALATVLGADALAAVGAVHWSPDTLATDDLAPLIWQVFGHMPGDPRGLITVYYIGHEDGAVWRVVEGGQQRLVLPPGPVVGWQVAEDRVRLDATLESGTVVWTVLP